LEGKDQKKGKKRLEKKKLHRREEVGAQKEPWEKTSNTEKRGQIREKKTKTVGGKCRGREREDKGL